MNDERIPKGWKKIEAYICEHNGQIIIMHNDRPPEAHNCDEMGCGSLDHVWMRVETEREVGGSYAKCGSYTPTKTDKIRHIYCGIKSKIYMACHAIWWRFLWFTRLARPYSKTMCKFNLYRKYPDGRCQWCGVKH